MRKKVFERFFRLPAQEQTGSGLGLAIAERAALRNNASIRLDAGPAGKGLAAIVEFNKSPASKDKASLASGKSGRSKAILNTDME
jgi:signal transduction histidine kinase